MKKTKPVKGSARTKKFDAGGLAALAGLGALAYMMRKKKGEEGADKFKDLEAVGGADRRPRTIEEQIGRKAEAPAAVSAELRRAMDASRGRPELIPEGADEAVMRSDKGIKRAGVKPEPKPKARGAAAAAAAATSKPGDKARAMLYEDTVKASELGSQGSFRFNSKLTPDQVPKGGQSKVVGEGELKPYPKDVKPKDSSISTSGFGPKLTYGTPSQLDASKAAMRRYREDEKEKKTRSAADIRAGRYRSGGSVSSASKRADGIAQRGKTKGRMV